MTKKEKTIRPPVVVVLGHVDHGKSSILEAIKDFKITSKESGGITQHIGAYEVEHKGKKITFLDTPGHEAFCAIRSRGAKVADIAVLVVAADEGIKPQTLESIKCIQEFNLPAIIAVNKVDRPGANIQNIKNELTKHNVLVEELGGKIPVIETSATEMKGIEELIDMILLTAEMEEFKAIKDTQASGVVIEAHLDKKRGPTATLLIKEGILKLQDILATNSTLGKVKIMENFQSKDMKTAYPSQPVVVIGFEKVPNVGEEFKVFSTTEEAKDYINVKKEIKESISSETDKKTLNLIIKADVLGSLEAIENTIDSLPQSEILIKVIKKGVGEINEDDIKLALSGEAKIFAFRVKANLQANRLAQHKEIPIFSSEVIYDLIEKIKESIKEIVESEIVRRDVGKLKVLIVFKTDPTRQIIGGRIIEGEFTKGLKLDIVREGKKIGGGKIIGLQKDKKEIEKAEAKEEIGILYEGRTKIKEGDVLIVFLEEKKKIDI